ncbi:basic amino acid ABC transporter substrate-binding protein [Selenihalanaerobacter shriftii]|uniref:Amino acid ABC transporter substrate-binding protein, PAAT family n=1 Tax=Selenihalanaerobacter shriftii TaxID=142842 RepID=A0A1T4KLB4_9FIRM|nr:basic amino acid ABC transporter substrate-binding protein [Selenihalanaerobacter shriftii]SJZ43232.1 amino acid ABC transporter substrate-binding protein, PAAT family [Selenihalanaerobacter shriftii]
MSRGVKLFLVALLGLALVVGVVGCSGGEQEKANTKEETMTTFDKIKEKGKIVIGSDASYKPFEYHNAEGEIVGFDVDFLNAIGKELGIEVEFVDTAFDGIIPGLNANKYDIAVSAMTITEKREKAVDFTEPYFNAGQVIAVMEGTNDIKTTKDLKGKVVAVQLGTTGDLKATKDIEGIKEVKRYEKITQAFIELKNGRADAVVNDLPVTAAYIMENSDVKMVGKPFTEEQYGIATREEDNELEKALNDAIAKLKENGTYDEIHNKWFK